MSSGDPDAAGQADVPDLADPANQQRPALGLRSDDADRCPGNGIQPSERDDERELAPQGSPDVGRLLQRTPAAAGIERRSATRALLMVSHSAKASEQGPSAWRM
jgi:hypothetical protein